MNEVSVEMKSGDKIAELEMANCMLADFAALVSHDIRTALRHVMSYAELLAVAPTVNAHPGILDRVRSIIFAARRIQFLADGALASPPFSSSTVLENPPKEKFGGANAPLESRIEELQNSHRNLTNFADSVVRGLRTPLGQIATTVTHLTTLQPITANPISLDLAGKILAGAHRMQTLIENYFSFANTERNAICRCRASLESLVQLVRHELEPMSVGRKVSWRVGALPEVEADISMLRQVFVNLLSNSLKYTYKCPEAIIEIGARPASGEHIIFVRDNGLGFDLESADALFRKFVRLQDNGIVPGVGIGLVIVKHIIQRHDGRVWAEGLPGGGAAFFFTLPAASQPA